MKKTSYWIATALVGAAFVMGGVMDLARGADIRETMTHLGYPAYLATLLGLWKLAGAVAVLVPGLPRLKEWAYAGMMFDLTGAAVSHAASGDGVAKIVTPLAILGLVAYSWAQRPATRKLA